MSLHDSLPVLSGAMSPATLAGALAQQHAEAMAGLALAQLVNPGTPVVYGGFTSNVDMKSGAPAFGTPEYTRAAIARSEEHTSELQSLMRTSYAVFCLKKQTNKQ